MDKLWNNSNKSSGWGMSIQHTIGWGSTTSTSGLSASTSGWSTNDWSSSLVTNEDVSAVIIVRGDNSYTSKVDGWERCYSPDHKGNYFHKIGKIKVGNRS